MEKTTLPMGKAAQEDVQCKNNPLGLSPYLSVAGGAGTFKIQSPSQEQGSGLDLWSETDCSDMAET